MLPWHPASGPVCARALHAKELWTADALDNAAGDDTDDGIWSVTLWAGCSRTPLYLTFTAWGGISKREAREHGGGSGAWFGCHQCHQCEWIAETKAAQADVTALLFFSVVIRHAGKCFGERTKKKGPTS